MSYKIHTCVCLRVRESILNIGARGIAQAGQEKPKNLNRELDDNTIESMSRYYKVDDKNFEALINYIRSRGLLDNTK